MLELKEKLGFFPNGNDLLALNRGDLRSAMRLHGGAETALAKLEGREFRTP